ncbi:MAG: GNAT family N-acetyltransferase [Janthinobacterium lividum]
MNWPEPKILRGTHARLVPLSLDHLPALCDAARDGEMWTQPYTPIPKPERMQAEIERRLALQAAGSMLPFTVMDNAGQAFGMTTYMNIEAAHRRLEIGSTWYRRSVQRTPVNTECKLMLLTRAFEELHCVTVELRCHALNTGSRRAIERLGAKLDGILRSNRVEPNGSLRDTCVYSIIACEWPTVRTHLQWQLTRPREATA